MNFYIFIVDCHDKLVHVFTSLLTTMSMMITIVPFQAFSTHSILYNSNSIELNDIEAVDCTIWPILQGVVNIWARIDTSTKKSFGHQLHVILLITSRLNLVSTTTRGSGVYVLNNNTPRKMQLFGDFGLVK